MTFMALYRPFVSWCRRPPHIAASSLPFSAFLIYPHGHSSGRTNRAGWYRFNFFDFKEFSLYLSLYWLSFHFIYTVVRLPFNDTINKFHSPDGRCFLLNISFSFLYWPRAPSSICALALKINSMMFHTWVALFDASTVISAKNIGIMDIAAWYFIVLIGIIFLYADFILFSQKYGSKQSLFLSRASCVIFWFDYIDDFSWLTPFCNCAPSKMPFRRLAARLQRLYFLSWRYFCCRLLILLTLFFSLLHGSADDDERRTLSLFAFKAIVMDNFDILASYHDHIPRVSPRRAHILS